MIRICAWCQAKGEPALLGTIEPLEDPSPTHGICEAHAAELHAERSAEEW